MVSHLDIKVYGSVQGVGFRWWVQKMAISLGICGIAQNLSDGSVLIEAEGENKDLEQFLKRCRQGPALAKVENLEENEGKVKGYRDFKIK